MTTAIIKANHNETYVSPVFALKYAGADSEIIAFDQSFSCIKRINMHGGGMVAQRRVFVVEDDFDGKPGNWRGYDWLLQDKAVQKALRRGKTVSIEDCPKLKEYTAKIQLPEWFEVKTQKDICSLQNVSFGFHDALIQEYAKCDDEIVIKFDTTWDCFITVRFAGVTEADIEGKVGQILDSEITQTEDGFCFTVTGGFAGWIDGIDYDAPLWEPYIKCKGISWQIAVSGVTPAQLLSEMVAIYNALDEKKGIVPKWNYFKQCHKELCKLAEDGEISIYAGDCEFEHLMKLIENDGPEFSATILFHDSFFYYEIGVCVRGTPVLNRININSMEAKRLIKNMWGKVGTYFDNNPK